MSATDVTFEIREAFANLPWGTRGQLSSLPSTCPAFVYVGQGTWGVAVTAAPDTQVSERFSGARLYSEPLNGMIELRLECGAAGMRNEFAVVCAQFLEPGANGEERARVLINPTDWWMRWRELLGNAIKQKRPYSVLGELLAYEKLLARGERPVWLGPTTNSHDIEAQVRSYEVKSTLSKYASTFHVAGQYQLRETADKTLYIIFQRFEPSTSGESINGVVARLRAGGCNIDQIEEALQKLGFESGASDRGTTYQLLQSTLYQVDDAFPRITPASFSGGGLPQGVVAIEYDVDLSGILGVPFI